MTIQISAQRLSRHDAVGSLRELILRGLRRKAARREPDGVAFKLSALAKTEMTAITGGLSGLIVLLANLAVRAGICVPMRRRTPLLAHDRWCLSGPVAHEHDIAEQIPLGHEAAAPGR